LTKTYGWDDDRDRLLILVWFFSSESRVCFSVFVLQMLICFPVICFSLTF
jgi:hypothetical protein